MAMVKFEMEAKYAPAMRAMMKMVDATDKVEKKAGGLNRTGKAATTTFQRFGQSSVQEMTRMVMGIASVTGAVLLIRKAWQLVTTEIERTFAAQKKLGEASYTMDQAAKAVMNQLGGAATIATAQGRMTEIMRAGRLADITQATGIAIAGNVAWGGLGEQRERGLVRTASEFIGRKGLSAEAGGAFIEVLGKMGVQTPQEVQRLSEQVFEGFARSQATSVSGYILGLQKAAPEMKAAGASNEMVIAALTRGRAVKASEEEAAQMNRQILMAMQRGNVQKALSKEFGMGREAWLGQDFETRFTQFGQWVSKYGATPRGQMLLGDVLPGRELGRTRAYFAPEGMTQLAQSRQQLQQITAERYQRESQRYAKMGIAGRENQRMLAEIDRVRADQMIKTGADLLLRADPMVDLILAKTTDLPEEIAPGDVPWLRRSMIARDREKSRQVMAKYLLSRRRWDILGRAEAAGMIDVGEKPIYQTYGGAGFVPRRQMLRGYETTIEPLMPGGEGFQQMQEDMEGMQPGRFTPGFGAAEVGRLIQVLENLEAALRSRAGGSMTPTAPVNVHE